MSLITTSLFGRQEAEIDSLSAFVLQTSDKAQKLEALNRLTFLLREQELDKALGYALTAESLALELDDRISLGRAKGNIGWIHYRKGNWNLAFRYSKDAYLMGIANQDNLELAMVLNNLGALYYQQTNYNQAISYFKEALSIATSIDDTYTVIRSLNNIALNYSKLDELDSALHFANMALETNEIAGSIYFTSFTLRVIGDVMVAKGELDEAITIYNNALTQASHQRLRSFESSVLHRLGKVYTLNGSYATAVELLERGRELAEEGGFKDELVQTYYNLYKIYDLLGNINLAYENLQKFTVLNQEQEIESDKSKLKLIQSMFEVDKVDAELSAIKAESQLKSVRLQLFQRFTFFGVLLSFILITLVLWMIFINRRKNILYQRLLIERDLVNKQKIDLEIKSQELNQANKTKNKILSIIGHDLKAPIGQLKGVLQLLVDKDLSKTEFEEVNRKILLNLDELYSNMDNVLYWAVSQMGGFKIQQELIELHEPVYSAFNLLKFTAEEKNILIEIDVPSTHLIETDKNILTLIIRNVLSNAIKFSEKYSVISIKSSSVNNKIVISIKDSGKGMSSFKIRELIATKNSLVESSQGTEKETGTGLGYSLINDFIGQIGGAIQIFSEEEKGSEVLLIFENPNQGVKTTNSLDISEDTSID
ncbi:ATP-binding protein [Mongoliitalea daihaiensis]|uniref:ATP-binding protein n=1 Tax=Mongoliitalea daihaiensis TaxID=2782006 RepID=UPI001F4157F5|nr:tetratricopeptide repeat protein [Mongoliitalea daihaiensis]UJP64548.1 tetratricopeptide repeat-containing sensor histidine kinase [Mongoliitalea daihaiensis]